MYPNFKSGIQLGHAINTVQGITNPFGVQCVTVDWAYAAFLFPNVSIHNSITTGNANTLFANSNGAYFQKIANNHNDPNQLPQPGDIMVFAGTPAAGYSNTFQNPEGHTGICDSASSGGYALMQQNAPHLGDGVNITSYPWKFRPCIGWLRPIIAATPQPVPPPTAEHTVHLPASVNAWHTYNVDGPYDLAHATHTLNPAKFGGLTYAIVADKGNGVLVINTKDFGEVAIWTKGTVAVIN